ncbi:hypothetical protein PSTT_07040 [Puccinia striiformis]|uniref:Uncharacterized protein n=1 Tax=Puccinia striiformis TaxID=27350 RepID=A0A2S4VI58_9BASI|nr:hypothetical protein PSTT_07040 [Puccinia striiformis]
MDAQSYLSDPRLAFNPIFLLVLKDIHLICGIHYFPSFMDELGIGRCEFLLRFYSRFGLSLTVCFRSMQSIFERNSQIVDLDAKEIDKSNKVIIQT